MRRTSERQLLRCWRFQRTCKPLSFTCRPFTDSLQVILDSASSFGAARPQVNGVDVPNEYKLLAISASSEGSLNRREAQIRGYFEQNPGKLQDLSYTMGSRRDHLRCRSYLIASGKSIIPARHVNMLLAPDSRSREVTFVFPGQGAQWPAMGKELLIQLDRFRNDMKQMDDVLQSLEDSPSWRIEGTYFAHAP